MLVLARQEKREAIFETFATAVVRGAYDCFLSLDSRCRRNVRSSSCLYHWVGRANKKAKSVFSLSRSDFLISDGVGLRKLTSTAERIPSSRLSIGSYPNNRLAFF